MSHEQPSFLANKYTLHTQPEVADSVEKLRTEGERIPETKDARIAAHFTRIDRIHDAKRELFVDLVREKLQDSYTLQLTNEDGTENEERIASLVQGLFDSEKAILERRGHGTDLAEYGDTPKPEDFARYKEQLYAKQKEQRDTLAVWVDYLGSEEADSYPTWFKYVALRALQKMGARNRDTNTYSKRSNNTVQAFPDLSSEALALCLDALSDSASSNPDVTAIAERGDFASLYAYFMGKNEQVRREMKEGTAGEWHHFPKGSNPRELYDTLKGKGTEWCTAGLDVATTQLKTGEFDIYYTLDAEGRTTNPRIAIYRIEGTVSEVRGIYNKSQDIELEFLDIAREKYQEFPGSESFEKKDQDMKMLSQLQDKQKQEQPLTKEDLTFLYELNAKIEGFGRGDDPRVKELRNQRDPHQDMLIIFECTEEQIAHTKDEINESTKAYVGPLTPGIFDQIQTHQIEHVYTSFPEGRVEQITLTIGGKDKESLKSELKTRNVEIGGYANDMLDSNDFTTLQNPETQKLVKLPISALGFTESPTTDELYARAAELGLELCPAEIGPHLRLQDSAQSQGWYRVAMKQIADRDGRPDVFGLGRDDGGSLWLDDCWTRPGRRWSLGDEFVFRLREVFQKT